MGDRNNPIKFGPEWLRNLSRERSASASANNSQNTASASGTTTSGTASGSSGGMQSASATLPNTNTSTASKVQLAKLRYGREEMLALYDRTSEAPQELKYIDILYQPRGKPPVALNNSFDEDLRDTMRTGPPLGGMSPGERFIGRGVGRGMNVTEVRGRPRLPFVRQLSAGRGVPSWHLGSPRMPGYSGGADDDSALPLRAWSNSNGGNAAARGTGDQAEWTPNKTYRSKRPGGNTNWRSARDEEEWRGADNNRPRPPQDKWERDWGDNRPAHRRTWVGGDTQSNDDNLPEWAVDNAEACGGTFDSSGAFHGYSNDDSNLPKSQESGYALTRSHTHGSFVRSKTVEEGSEEWWASEKAKKLSPKRFDASDIKFKKPNAVPELSPGSKTNTNKEEPSASKTLENPELPAPIVELPDNNSSTPDDSFNKKSVRFAESKTFDALMRSDINMDEANDERGNFQSVMITPNNSLRQKHQNIVSSGNNSNNKQNRKHGILQMLHNNQQITDSEISKQHSNPEDKIVEDIMDMALDDEGIISTFAASDSMMPNTTVPAAISSVMSTVVNSVSQMSSPAMQLRMSSPIHPVQGLAINPKPSMATPVMPTTGLQTQGIQPVGMTNSALNASLGLPLGKPNSPMGQNIGIPMHGVPSPVMPNQSLGTPGMGSTGLPPNQLPSYQGGGGLPNMSASNVGNSSMFLGQNTNNATLQSNNNHGNQNLFAMHGLQHSGSPAGFNSSLYSNIMQQSPTQNPQNSQGLTEQWYYEDPKKIIQGPFTSKEMYSWYRAGFFSSSLMVRRACDAVMRPLGSYGPVVPFAQMDHMMSPFPMGTGYEPRNQGPHDSLLNSQPRLGLDVMSETSSMDTIQFGSVGIIRNPPFNQQQMVESLWSQPPSQDMLWMQQAMNARNETRVNNLPMFFWDQQPSALASNSLLPEGIAKEMKTEDEILAQLRAQNVNTSQKLAFGNEQPPLPAGPPPVKPDDAFASNLKMRPNLEELHKMIQNDNLKDIPLPPEPLKQIDKDLAQVLKESEPVGTEVMKPQTVQNKQPAIPETKTPKQAKTETEKTKSKDNTKLKNSKKLKDDKKDDVSEVKAKDEEISKEKRSEESSPAKPKKEDKLTKKEMEKEKNQWIKDGFTIVKTEKNLKEFKKKIEEIKAVEDAERKRKEEEQLAAEDEKIKRQTEILRRQQELQQQQQQRQAAESVAKKAPWSAAALQAMQAPSKEGPTLAEIQRLEREKKLEQMKEQQQMMQIIAQQQAAALAREQEMQAGLGWAKKKANLSSAGQSLAEIQAEARRQAMAMAAATAAAASFEEAHAAPAQPVSQVPWGNSYNGGFWDTQPAPIQKVQEAPKVVEALKKKPTLTPAKKEVTPAAEFETWCTTVLASWSTKIDVPTFVGFLKDIESPYEVKDYVKCYLGDTKDSNDFARQFLERRSKLLRVGMVTPSDDLCSPAMAVNPRTPSSDYQEVKSKGKKTKKNKMMKVDAARLLGFSVTASEDRINVGDIDTV